MPVPARVREYHSASRERMCMLVNNASFVDGPALISFKDACDVYAGSGGCAHVHRGGLRVQPLYLT